MLHKEQARSAAAVRLSALHGRHSKWRDDLPLSSPWALLARLDGVSQGRVKPPRDRLHPKVRNNCQIAVCGGVRGILRRRSSQLLTYLDNQWAALRRYTDDGRLRIDNGEVERLQRLVAVGRKNWLFFGSDEGARRGAVLYSVIATCVLNQVNPLHYIADVLQKLAVGWNHSALEELLPARWLQTRPHALLPPPNA